MGHLYVLFGVVSIQIFCPFFNWIVCLPGFELYKFFTYLEINPLSEVSLNGKFLLKRLAKEHICTTHRHGQQCGDGPRDGEQGLSGGGQRGVDW